MAYYTIYFFNCILVYFSENIYSTVVVKMCARFVSLFFGYFPKIPFSVFTYQKSSQIFRDSLCRPLSVVGEINFSLQYPSNRLKYTTSDPMQVFWRIKQGSDGNRTEIGMPKVTDIDYNIVAPFYWMQSNLLFGIHFCMHNYLKLIIKIYSTIYLSLAVIFPSIPSYWRHESWLHKPQKIVYCRFSRAIRPLRFF